MKKYSLILFCLVSIINSSCSQTVTMDKVIEHDDGIIYEVSTQKPFTGIVKEEATEDKGGYEGRFVNGKPEGKHRRYEKKDSIVFECNYLDGEKHGDYLSIYSHGAHVFHYKHGKKDGAQFEFYDHQRLKKKLTEFFKNGVIDGETCYYYQNGNIEELFTSKNGIMHGKHTKSDENGTLRLEEYYLDGKLDGLSQEFYENGSLKKLTCYKKGKIHGKYILYYSNNNKWVEIDYVEDKKHGKDIMYNFDGTPNDIRVYNHGEYVEEK